MPDLARLRVLLVEDNALDALMIERSLAKNPETRFEVNRVGDLRSALDLLDSEAFDCVLLDLSLPDSRGLLGVDSIIARAAHAPVVVFTGLDDPTTAVEAVDRGASDYLQKGQVKGDLVARSIRYAVARHHAELALRSTSEQLRLATDRGRIARDLHDTVVQQLFATGMGLHALAGTVDDEKTRATLATAVDEIDVAIRQLREAIFDLHIEPPGADHDHEIDEAIRSQRASLGFQPSIVKRNTEDIEPSLRHEVSAVVREALANIAKHANATHAEVSLTVDSQWVIAEVTDNGRGVNQIPEGHDPDTLSGNGLRNMERRATALSGTFSLHPGPGGGSCLVWRVPNRSSDSFPA